MTNLRPDDANNEDGIDCVIDLRKKALTGLTSQKKNDITLL